MNVLGGVESKMVKGSGVGKRNEDGEEDLSREEIGKRSGVNGLGVFVIGYGEGRVDQKAGRKV